MDYKVVESTQIVWCGLDDRYVRITKRNNEVIGLSYMQGDELDDFKEHFSEIDYDLTDFYNAIESYLSGPDELDRINQAIWAHFNYRNLRDERWVNVTNKIKL